MATMLISKENFRDTMRHKDPTQREEIFEEFKGVLFTSIKKSENLCVILIPGSDGGIPEALAQFVASHGYPTLALGYFASQGLPPLLENIPLEYFLNPLNFMRKKFHKVILMGYSRGGELVLLLGSLFSNLIDGIIAHVPSSLKCGAFPHINLPAWKFNNLPITPFLKALMSSDSNFSEIDDLKEACEKGNIPYHEGTEKDPYEIVDLFYARKKEERSSLCYIDVDRIICPLLILAGEDDRIWPSAEFGKEIIDRLDAANSPINRKLIIYPKAGHGFIANHYKGSIFHPIGKFWCRLGGTEEGNRAANKDSWEKIFEFLKNLS